MIEKDQLYVTQLPGVFFTKQLLALQSNEQEENVK